MSALSYYTEDRLNDILEDEIWERIECERSTTTVEKVESAMDVIRDMVEYIESIGDDIIEDKIKTPTDYE